MTRKERITNSYRKRQRNEKKTELNKSVYTVCVRESEKYHRRQG